MNGLQLEGTDFDQFLDFLTHLSTELASGISPEYALVRTYHYFGKQTPDNLLVAINDVANGVKAFRVAWSDLVIAYGSSRYSRLLELLGRFIDKGSVVGGNRMLQVLKQVRKNYGLTKNRQNLVKGQRVKVFALSFVSAVVIGMIAAIAPLLSLTFYQGGWNSTIDFSSRFSVYVVVASIFTILITGYRLNKTVDGPIRSLVVNLVAFGTTFIFISHLLTVLM
ncbi:MAG: hypothetical protein ACFE9D_03595 [Promethearchaeota archaeon]